MMMGKIERFEDYDIWKEGRMLCKEVYDVSRRRPFFYDFSLKNQIRSASGSIMDNIAEGHGRGGNKEFIYFLSVARGSNSEVMSQLYRALDQSYISAEEFNRMYERSQRLGKKISNFIKYLKNAENKGFRNR